MSIIHKEVMYLKSPDHQLIYWFLIRCFFYNTRKKYRQFLINSIGKAYKSIHRGIAVGFVSQSLS